MFNSNTVSQISGTDADLYQISSTSSPSAGAPPLGTIASKSSPASQCGSGATPLAGGSGSSRDYGPVVRRFALQSAARDLLPRERVAVCLRRPVPGQLVDVLYAPAARAAHYGGLQTCGSVWHCPVCSAKVSERRRVELSSALAAWSLDQVATPRRLLLVTFTLQHKISDNLAGVLGALKRARKLLISGKYAVAFTKKYGIVGMVRTLELTYGDNGWHPHLHVLYFFGAEVPMIPFTDEIKLRWGSAVKSAGSYASYQYGCDVRFTDADIAEYIAKWGKEPKWTTAHEMTKSVSKYASRDGRTPLQLLSEYFDGNQASGRLWFQYAVNLKGERQLRWSRGLRVLLGLEVEKTDEELAAEQEEIAVILASLSIGAWRVVVANDARAELLEVAASGDKDAVFAFLRLLGVGDL